MADEIVRPFKSSVKIDNEHNLEMQADLDNKIAEVVNLVTGEMYTSGESSDLSLAEVTFKRGNVAGIIVIDVALAYTFDSNDCTTGGIGLSASENEVTVDVILYKGKAYANANEGNLTLSGDNFDSETECVTGAGVITIDN